MARLLAAWRNLTHRSRVERDLDDEVRGAFEMLVAEKIDEGLGPDAARRAATLELGRIETVKDAVRDVRAGSLLDAVLLDLGYAARLLRRNPVFTLTAGLSLAIGIGATTTIFTAANGLLLRTAPGVGDPAALVDINRTNGQFGVNPISGPNYRDIRDRATTLDGVYVYRPGLNPVNIEGAGVSGGAEPAFLCVVSSTYFTVLGVPPALGRVFGERDKEQLGTDPIVVLSYDFWTRRFDGNPAVIGQVIRLNDVPYTVVGVAKRGFLGTTVVAPDLWIPLGAAPFTDPGVNVRAAAWALMGGRVKAGVTRAQAAAEIDAIGRALEQDYPTENHGYGLSLSGSSPIPAGLRGVAAGFFALLLAVVSLVLVSASTNVAGVLLARGAARRREIAVRLAMGVSRGRLIRQLLTEALLLFALGGAAGIVLARLMTTGLLSALPAFELPVYISLPLDLRVLAFATLISLIAALLSGLAPALHASRVDVVLVLKDEGHGPSDRLRLRSAFVIAQVAVSILVLVVAGLLLRALDRASHVDQGFDPRGVEVASLDLDMGGYTNVTGPLFASELIARLREVPGVEAATLAFAAPAIGGGMGLSLSIPGQGPVDGQPHFTANGNIVAPGYFAAMRIPLVAGRDFSEADRDGAAPAVIVSESAARRFWPGKRIEEVIGLFLESSGGVELNRAAPDVATPRPRPSSRWLRRVVIGVARDLGTAGSTVPPYVYLPFLQQYTPNVTILARAGRRQRPGTEIRALVSTMNSRLPVISSRALEEQAGPVITQLRLATAVSGSVGLVGLLLAAIGIYGVTAYTVARRTREIGIRIALGARRADVIRMILRQGMTLVGVGSAIGLLAAAAAGRVLTRWLYGMPPLDPVTFIGAVVLFAAIGLVACWIPARRATLADAMDALRYE